MLSAPFHDRALHKSSSDTPRLRPLPRRLEETALAERRRALRALLRSPLLSAAGPHAEEFTLVHRHSEWLKEWLLENAGWTLALGSDLARLRKVPGDPFDGTRGYRDRRGSTFTRRRYVLLCLALAALERSDRQTTLGRLATEVAGLLAADPGITDLGITLDLTVQDHRRDLVAVMRVLLDLVVLVRVDGTEESFLDTRGDVLYSINRPCLSSMLAVRRGPSTIHAGTLSERIAMLCGDVFPDTEEGRNRRIRWRLTRILLDDPAIYYDQLSAEERTYAEGQRPALLRQVQTATGLLPEVRREGLAMVDADGDLSDVEMAQEGTDAHFTLLIAERLASHARLVPGDAMGVVALRAHARALIDSHRHHWRKDTTAPGADLGLLEAALARLEALRLVRRVEDGVLPLPAIGRYSLASDPANAPHVVPPDADGRTP